MVKKTIQIYARLKHEKPEHTTLYEIVKRGENESVTFFTKPLSGIVNNKPHSHTFRFEKAFDENSTQDEVFDIIAKPVVNSVLDGFNGTVFAYGQTGSGKTYAMTGSSDNYHERGLIPRSIEEIFKYINNNSKKCTVYVSYLEIYNETGYDLLNPKQRISSTEEVSKVSLLDTGKGETLLRNLKVYRVSTEEEAMKLLLMGDTNRMTVETPMNVYSSRSHCIFTMCIIVKNNKSGKLRRSKLTLVDLAGSERISKSGVTGATLHEARHINLSLHYLQQVVTTLCQGKSHVPFRNSLLTYLLKDSLTGNCLTVLIATLAINKKNMEETIATCKFAQRVADVNIEANINEEIDSHREIEFLRKEIGDLQRQLMEKTQYNGKKSLSKEDQDKWKKMVNNYLQDTNNELPINSCHIREVQYCFKLLKQTVKDQENQALKIKSEEDIHKDLIDQYKKSIQEKEEEIQFFKSLIYNDSKPSLLSVSFNSNVMSKLNSPNKENISPNINTSNVPFNQVMVFQAFLKDEENSNELDFYREAIRDTYKVAVGIIAVIEECQRNILDLKTKIRSDEKKSPSTRVKNELTGQQSIYQKSLSKLQDLKNQTDCLRCGLENAKLNVMKNFEKWCYEMDVHFGTTTANLNRSINFEKVSDELMNQQDVNPNLFNKSHCLKHATKPFSRVVETANLNEKETFKACCDKEDCNKFSTNTKKSKHNSDKLNNELSDQHFVYENLLKQSQDLKDKTELRSLMGAKLSDKKWCNKENYCATDTTTIKFNTNEFNLVTMNDEVVGQQPANRNSLKNSHGLTNEAEYYNCNSHQATLSEEENFKNWCVNKNYAVECNTTATASKGNKFNYLRIKDKQSTDRKSQCLRKEREYLRRRLDETEYFRQKLIKIKLNANENIIQKRQDTNSLFHGKFGAATINFNKDKFNSENINDEPVDQQALYWNSPKNSRDIQDEEELNKPKFNVAKDDSTAITKNKLIDQQQSIYQGSKDKAGYFRRSLEKSKLKKINLNRGCDRESYGNFSATSSNFQQRKFQIQDNIIPYTTTRNAMNDSVSRKYNRNASANSKGYNRSKFKSQRIPEGFARKNNYFEQNNTKDRANHCGDQNCNSYSQKFAVYTIYSPKRKSNQFSDLYEDVQNHSNGGASNKTFFTTHNEEYLNDLLCINKTYGNKDLCARKISTSSEKILDVIGYDSDYPKEITISALPSRLHSSLKANPIITTEIENNVKPRQPFNTRSSPSNRQYITQAIPEEEIRKQSSAQTNNSIFQEAFHERQLVYDAILKEPTAKQSSDDNYSFETPRTKGVQLPLVYNNSPRFSRKQDHSKILNIRPSSSPTKINMKQHVRRSSTPTCKMNQQIQNNSFLEDDPQEFRDFMSTVPLTGDLEVDQEIINFYRTKYAIRK